MCVFFSKQKTAYEMRIGDWSSDVCSSDLAAPCGLTPPNPLRGTMRGPVRRCIIRTHLSIRIKGYKPDVQHPLHLRVGLRRPSGDRKSVVEGKSVSACVDLGGRRLINR